ncbi:hypothetical protein [Sphingobium sp. UBA5915]|uniref:hypothetical protein n=1 Tax=Sphingobium sp. UBA5915 TaxID=1947530 RepID=UPI0025FACBD7|nr:hypothetical protein [Sphingobium sp. UBA5915]
MAEKGDVGPPGPASAVPGPQGQPGAILAGNLTITQTAAVAISAGIRSLSYTLTGVKSGDALSIVPTGPLPAGYAIHNIVATGNNAVQVTLTAPLLAIGASYSIPCRVYKINI